MSRRFLCALLSLACGGTLAATLVARAAEAPTEQVKADADAPKDYLAERNQKFAAASKFASQYNWDEAVRAAKAGYELHHQHLGLADTGYVFTLKYFSEYQERQGDFQGALASWRELQALCPTVKKDGALAVAFGTGIRNCERILKFKDDEQRRLGEAASLDAQSKDLYLSGKYAESLEKGLRGLEIRSALLGRDDSITTDSLFNSGLAYLALSKPAEARPLLEASAAAFERQVGLHNTRTAIALKKLAEVHAAMRNFKDEESVLQKYLESAAVAFGRDDFWTYQGKYDLATCYLNQGEKTNGESTLLAVLESKRQLHGAKHAKIVDPLTTLGKFYEKIGDFDRATQRLAEAVALARELFGNEHQDTAEALDVLSFVEENAGDDAAAEKHAREALAIRSKVLGPTHPITADSIAAMASIVKGAGDFAKAQRLARQALEIRIQALGENHPSTSLNLVQLGHMSTALNDYVKAGEYFERALAIDRKILGEDDVRTCATMLAMATVHTAFGRFDEAERLCNHAISIYQKSLAPDDLMTVSALGYLGHVYEAQKKYTEAEQTYQRARALQEKKHGPDHSYTVTYLERLARVAFLRENYAEADALADRVLDIYRRTLPELHRDWWTPLHVGASAKAALGDNAQAKVLYDHALRVARAELENAATVQSERQRMSTAFTLRESLDLYLSLPRAEIPDDEIYGHVLLTKGAVQARQMRDRQDRGADVAPLLAELHKVSRRLTTVSLQVPPPAQRESWLKQLDALKQQRDEVEGKLAYSSEQFRAQRETAAVAPQKLRAVLPRGIVLVDVFYHLHVSYSSDQGKPTPHEQWRFVAFVVRGDRPIARVDLGPTAPIDAAIKQWRASSSFKTKYADDDPAHVLRRLVWAPLMPHVEGCQTVLFSPDGALARLPLGVLPGDKPGNYLIEERAIGIIPVPQMLPEMLATKTRTTPNDRDTAGLLLVGDVDYDAASADADAVAAHSASQEDQERSEGGRGELITFAPLKSTGPEVRALDGVYRRCFPDGRSLLLEKAAATEAAFCREAPQHAWMLLATHGFFAPPSFRSALAVQDEMLRTTDLTKYRGGALSGVALAGANKPTAEGDDGILTATEVSALDLRNADLVVLSGCETGLGETSLGEGTLGLQRAFHAAGARTTVSSLWCVPDRKTSQLIERFHANLWEKKLSKLEALREAQIWMLRSGGQKPASDKSAKPTSLAPYYWAAFVLSGDWR